MCDYKVTEKTSSSFVLYNLVFGASKASVFNSESLSSELKKYNKTLDKRSIDDSLAQWYRDGRLNSCQGGYVLA